MDSTGVIYLAFSLIIVLITFSMLPYFGPGIYRIIAVIVLLMTVVLILMLNWIDFLVFPAVSKLLGMTFQPMKDYKIVKSQDAIVKNVGGIYYAIGYLTANLFAYTFKAENPEEDVDSRIADAPDRWEKAVSGIDFPFKFHVLSCGRDVQKARDALEGKRGYVEFQMARMAQSGKQNDSAMEELQRKQNIIQTQMDRISQGEKPISTIMYIETVGVGVTEKSALDNLAAQEARLQVALSSLDVQIIKIVGRELYSLFNFNFSLPTVYSEVASNFDSQG
ncbi:conserved hypothetical protein, membrane [mine drainage metagenome]|uniref:Uncharacterized protein n=1 Tax=mine drainage metagenome TaxID=410659 RepID=T1BIY8_9ZZZZ